MLVCLNVAKIFFLIVTKMGVVWQFSFVNSPAHELQKLLNCYVHTDGWTAISVGAQFTFTK